MIRHHLAAKYRNDPTQAKKISDRVEEELVGLFEQAKKDLEKILPEDKALEYRTNAIPAERLPQYFKKVDETFQYVNERGAEVFGRKLKDGTTVGEIPKAWQQGQVYAGIQLGAPYEVRKVAWEQIGNRIVEGQSDLKKLTDENAGRVRQIIADGIIKERKFGDITRDIVRETDKVGINRAVLIARTETMRAVNDGVLDRYKKSDVQYVKWLAAGDERTCPDCKDLDGKIFPIDEVPPCPKHPSCRCTWTPVVRMPGEKEKEPTPTGILTGEEIRERTLAIAQKQEKERAGLEQRLAKANEEMQVLADRHGQYVKNFFDAKQTGNAGQMAYWEKEVLKVGDECDRYIQLTRGIQTELDGIKATQNKAIHDLLYLREKPIVNYQVGKTSAVYEKNKKALDEGFEFFGRVVKDDPAWKAPVKVNTARSGRAYEKGGEIFISTRSDSKTVAHELGHVMEERSKTVVAAEREFYVSRTKTDPLISMNKATGAHGYRSTEKTKKDTFPDAYCGKDYQGRAYELISIGSGWLKSDPAWFAKTDPEYFSWTVNTLRGVL